MNQAPDTRIHIYNLQKKQDVEDAERRIQSFKHLALDADDTWKRNGYWHILVNELCLLLTYRKVGDILRMEWKTRHRSRVERK